MEDDDFDEQRSADEFEEEYPEEEYEIEEGEDEWQDASKKLVVQVQPSQSRYTTRASRRTTNSKLNDDYIYPDFVKQKQTQPQKKRKGVESEEYDEEYSDEDEGLRSKSRRRDSLKEKKKKATVKAKKKGSKKKPKREPTFDQFDSSDGEHVLVIDDPNSFYASDEYDSDGKLIHREEEKKKKEEEERTARRLKRKKNTPHLVKKYTPVPMDENGKPIMPIRLKGGLTILSLGRINPDNTKFHAKRYIWPLGFKSERVYSSMTELDKRCIYTSEISERDGEPLFIVTCWEKKDNPYVIERPTPSGAWAEVGKRFFELKKEITGKDTMTQLSGPEMFGFAHPTIAKLIQEMPGAEKCEKYIPQQFVPASAKIKGIDDRPKYKRRKKDEYIDSEDEAEDAFDMDEEYIDDMDVQSQKKKKKENVDKKNKKKKQDQVLQAAESVMSQYSTPSKLPLPNHDITPTSSPYRVDHAEIQQQQQQQQPHQNFSDQNNFQYEEEEEEVVEESGSATTFINPQVDDTSKRNNLFSINSLLS